MPGFGLEIRILVILNPFCRRVDKARENLIICPPPTYLEQSIFIRLSIKYINNINISKWTEYHYLPSSSSGNSGMLNYINSLVVSLYF